MTIAVFIAAEVEPKLIELLRGDLRFELAAEIGAAEVLITRTINRVDVAMLDRAPKVRWIAQGTSGIDNIDVDAAKQRGIEVIHLPGVNANAVAELVIGQMIALTRTLPQYVREMQRGEWRRSDCATRHELRHYALGIVGLGNVGRRVARLANAFGMKITAYDPYIEDFGIASRAQSLQQLLRASDIVTLHVPLTEETRRMIGAGELSTMPRGAILINAARGEVLDFEPALSALAAGHLSGLAVDVFENEPLNRPFAGDPRLIVTPHIAGCTYEAKNDAAELLYARITEIAG